MFIVRHQLPPGNRISTRRFCCRPASVALLATGLDLPRPLAEIRLMAMGMLIASAAAFPEVQIEPTSARENMSLRRRDADVAVRIADDVPQWLVGRKLADL
jgi:hypothetical protein